MSDFPWMSAAAMAEAIRSRRLGPVEITQAYLDRIDRLNPQFHAYVSVYPDQALQAARVAEAAVARGDSLGPLHGVPLAIKDLFLVTGMMRTCGSKLVREKVSPVDAASVAALREAGAIFLGMANLHEFAFGPTGINPHFGTALNPWDATKVCGGSSSGSGCAVAAGLGAGAMGTDTGGSVRLPAALCGIVGLKPTHLRISQDGIYPLVGEFDTGGPMARCVEDIAVMMAALDPAGGFDHYAPAVSLAKVRIGVPEALFESDVHPEICAAMRGALDAMETLGASVEFVTLDFADNALRAWNTIALGRVYALHGERASAVNSKLSPDVRDRIRAGRHITRDQINEALTVRKTVHVEMTDVMEMYDVLALPTVPLPAVNAADGRGDLDGRRIDGAAVLGRLTRLASFTGQPALSLPWAQTAMRLPIGLQMIGRWNADEQLLELAGALEAAGGWKFLHPEI
ncbi:MAG: amidase [Rhodospirillaceae bacterium]|nr:amidase [Rhodospirillaceae bacterium]MCY4309714.1 amidase [Rhodospirillaceae bacterium]